MEEKNLYQLAEFVLPSDILHYFSIVKIEPDSSLLRIYLDEKMEKELSEDLHFESKGFMTFRFVIIKLFLFFAVVAG